MVKYDNESNGVQYLNITFFGLILLIFLADKIQFIGFNVFIPRIPLLKKLDISEKTTVILEI